MSSAALGKLQMKNDREAVEDRVEESECSHDRSRQEAEI